MIIELTNIALIGTFKDKNLTIKFVLLIMIGLFDSLDVINPDRKKIESELIKNEQLNMSKYLW